ncbi:MAG: type IV pilin protein [Rhodothermales bacterium]
MMTIYKKEIMPDDQFTLKLLPMQFMKDQQGFSLTELMVVLVIIGILALLAIPRFSNVATKAKATEAKTMLKQVHTLQSSYHFEYDVYSSNLLAIGFEQVALVSDGGTARYRIDVETANSLSYIVSATSVVDFDKDGVFNVWQVDQTGRILERTPD